MQSRALYYLSMGRSFNIANNPDESNLERSPKASHDQGLIPFHPTSEDGIYCLLLMTLPEDLILAVMPFLCCQIPPFTIPILCRIFRSQEVRDGIAMLFLPCVDWDDSMDARVQLMSGKEPERVTDIDDGVIGLRRNELPSVGLWGKHLQAPLLTEQER